MTLDSPLLVRWEYESEERLAKRDEIQRELGAHVCAVDTSPRMVELVQARRLDARIADAESLPFRADDFECVLAASVLYHVRVAPQVPEITEPFRATTRHVVFVAKQPR